MLPSHFYFDIDIVLLAMSLQALCMVFLYTPALAASVSYKRHPQLIELLLC